MLDFIGTVVTATLMVNSSGCGLMRIIQVPPCPSNARRCSMLCGTVGDDVLVCPSALRLSSPRRLAAHADHLSR